MIGDTLNGNHKDLFECAPIGTLQEVRRQDRNPAGVVAPSSFGEPMEVSLLRVNDLSRSVASFEQSTTLVVVVEMGARSWLVAGTVPGVEPFPTSQG